MTPQLLVLILGNLDVSRREDAAVWAAALVMFYGLLRRSNVLTSSWACFKASKHLCITDLSFNKTGAQLCIRWSKTNQFAQRNRVLPLPTVNDHVLCPVKALYNYIAMVPVTPNPSPLFTVSTNSGCKPLSPANFVHRIRSALSPGNIETSDYAGHSFRRGGATWAFQAGLSVDTIRQLGDWRSNAYMQYIMMDTTSTYKAIQRMQTSMPL